MCGIIGYIGDRQAQSILLNSLKKLEYHGYDSSGVVVYLPHKKTLSVRKLKGKVKDLVELVKKKPLLGSLSLGHVRWATHGVPNQTNAHPHLDCESKIAVVHNGIIENYRELKEELIREGHRFRSQTDTEVIVHLIEKFYNPGLAHKGEAFEEAVRKAVKLLKGSFAIGIISEREPDKLVGARLGLPLIVGLGEKENFLASDIPALLDHTKKMILLEEGEICVLEKEKIKILDFEGKIIKREPTHIEWMTEEVQKDRYPHFMLKEIFEQPKILEKILNQRVRENRISFEELKISDGELSKVDNISIVGCGTAYHAGFVGKYVLERICRIPTQVTLSSEFRYQDPILNKDTLVVAISQSGETADTLAAVREAKKSRVKILGICNVLGSTLTRESDGIIYTHAGPEIGVASTKAYTAQLAILYLFSLYLAHLRGLLSQEKIKYFLESLKDIPAKQESILNNAKLISKISKKHSHYGLFLYLGRNITYPSALEGALKLKEISYIPAEGYAAGEMKHGPIALIDEYRAIVCIIVESLLYEKMLSNIQEILSRKGKIIAIATEGDSKIIDYLKEVIYVPKSHELLSPLLVAIPLQLLAYYIAERRGCEIDQPRNLAKSVTVE